jgi:hypothetical protein
MLIYEVNLELEEDINYKVAGWLSEIIQKVLASKGFKIAYWFFRKPEDEGSSASDKTLWTIHYIVEDQSSLNTYLNEQSPKIRTEAIDRFGEKLQITYRTLNLLNVMGLPEELAKFQAANETTKNK